MFVFHLVGKRRTSHKQSWCKNHFTKDQKHKKWYFPYPPSFEEWGDDGRWWTFLKTATTALRWRKAILKQRWAWSLDLMHAARLSALSIWVPLQYVPTIVQLISVHSCDTWQSSLFRRKAKLIQQDTGEKAHKCNQCLPCVHAPSFKIQMRTHMGEMSYKCSQCNYTCTRVTNLHTHMLTHTEVRAFNCDQCIKYSHEKVIS